MQALLAHESRKTISNNNIQSHLDSIDEILNLDTGERLKVSINGQEICRARFENEIQ